MFVMLVNSFILTAGVALFGSVLTLLVAAQTYANTKEKAQCPNQKNS